MQSRLHYGAMMPAKTPRCSVDIRMETCLVTVGRYLQIQPRRPWGSSFKWLSNGSQSRTQRSFPRDRQSRLLVASNLSEAGSRPESCWILLHIDSITFKLGRTMYWDHRMGFVSIRRAGQPRTALLMFHAEHSYHHWGPFCSQRTSWTSYCEHIRAGRGRGDGRCRVGTFVLAVARHVFSNERTRLTRSSAVSDSIHLTGEPRTRKLRL